MPQLTLETLKLHNYRCFESIDIDFDHQLTVLVAENGAGKSSILDAIAVAFGTFIGAFNEATGKHFRGEDIRRFRARETDSNEMEHAPDGVWLEATGIVPDVDNSLLQASQAPVVWHRNLSAPRRAQTTRKGANVLTKFGEHLQHEVRTTDTEVVLPLIAYYGTGRLWQQKKLTRGKSARQSRISRTSRTVGYTDCLDSGSSYKLFVDWFRYWSLNAKNAQIMALEAGETHQPVTEFGNYVRSVSQAVNTCLQLTGWQDIEYSYTQDALVARHREHGLLPVDVLSDGIRSMIAMVADIAFRATKLNGPLGADAAKQTPGIVLIDEVDMHLHPLWQQVVLQNLTCAFPQMQFIVTTHSPQVLSSVGKDHIRLLHYEQQTATWHATTPEHEVKGIESIAALREVMGVNPVPPVEQARWIEEYTAKIENGSHEDAQGRALRAKLEQVYGKQHPVLLDADKLIRFQSFKLRAESASKD